MPVAERQGQVGGQQSHHEGGDDQHMDGVEVRHQLVAGKFASEEVHRQVRSDDRDGQESPVHDGEAGPGEQVAREVVSRQPCQHGQDQQQESDQPVDLARLAECTREEDPHRVDEYGGDEDQRRPVVDLPDQQTAADVEGYVHGRIERLRHRLAA